MRRGHAWGVVWVLVLVGLPSRAPADPEVPEPRAEPAPSRAAVVDRFEAHVAALKERLPDGGKGFTIVTAPPFAVIGDGDPDRVRMRAEKTVRWAVERLKKAYFAQDPPTILDVYLFDGEASYRKHAMDLFGHTPHSPYGYYSPAERALIMNIATGGGTLVHEIVHPFVEANFPACPAWFNEGLASLYEQCGDRDGEIVGYPNWRLPILQKALRAGDVRSFEELCATTTAGFYRERRSVNYAQARYLCYYLQEKELLRRYYRAFVANHEKDPTGYHTLVDVLGEEDMEAFRKRWEAFVLELRYP